MKRSRSQNALQVLFNNRTLRAKIIWLYVFCVLIPVTVTCGMVFSNVHKASVKENADHLNRVADSIDFEFTSALESALYISYELYSSNTIYHFLETQYKSNSDYLQAYNSIFNNYAFYASSKHLISNITFYSNNPTMVNGGRYYRTDAVINEPWYQAYLSADKDVLIFPYYNHAKLIDQQRRMVSVIRRLSYLGSSGIDKYLKLDLNYDMISESLKKNTFDSKMYICQDQQILFTNDEKDKGAKAEYSSIAMLPLNDIQLARSTSAYGFEWDIYLAGYVSNPLAALKDSLWLLAVLLFADALIPAGMILLLSGSIKKRIFKLRDHLIKIEQAEFVPIVDDMGEDEIGELAKHYNLMAQQMENLIKHELNSRLEQQQLQLAKQQAELLALRAQINPHFIYNVLETIRMRSILKTEDETAEMIECLSKLMRKNAEWGSDLITLREELAFANDYLNLQQYRFGKGFHYRFRIQETCYDYIIPSLAVVTFVENACIHGLNRPDHTGSIFISAYEQDAFFVMEIEDTGIGIAPEKVVELQEIIDTADIDALQKPGSLGMLNAVIRFKMHCGEFTQITLESEPLNGTCVIVRMPLEGMRKG